MPVHRLVAFPLAALIGLATASPALAQPADQAAVDRSVEAGVRFLRQSQNPGGSWGTGTGPGPGKGWSIGHTALAGLALIEGGVPITDPKLQLAARGINANARELDHTYEVALAILFLDRMRDKSYRSSIQMLAGRLIAGQKASGGWGYTVPKTADAEAAALLAALRRASPPPPPVYPSARERPPGLGLCIKAGDEVLLRPAPAFDATKGLAAARTAAPPNLRNHPVFSDAVGIADDPKDAASDNSNTHFAMLGLWAARKHDVPTDRTLALTNARFRTSQGPNGTWAYNFARGGANGGGATTCIALLGVAIGYVVSPDPNVRPERDPLLLKAFAALAGTVGEPAGTTANRPKVKEVGGLYYLWAMERIAVLYDVQKLNRKDWYLWGAEILVGNQTGDGSWAEGGFHGENPVVNTAFAVLFLRRANLTPDLSRRLIVDTGTLTAKTNTPAPAPKVEPPPPKKAEPTQVVSASPPPQPKVEPPAPTPPAPAPQPTVTEPVASTPAPAPPVKKTPWLWIILGMLLAGIVGGGLAFVVVKKMKKDESEEDAPKAKKKGKKKPKDDEE